MSKRTKLCRDQHCYKPGINAPTLYLECQRELGHDGDHAALCIGGFIEWWDESKS